MSKRETVERAAGEFLHHRCQLGGSNERLIGAVQTLRASGFTICGPDEIPMPRANPQKFIAGEYLDNPERVEQDAYQAERNK